MISQNRADFLPVDTETEVEPQRVYTRRSANYARGAAYCAHRAAHYAHSAAHYARGAAHYAHSAAHYAHRAAHFARGAANMPGGAVRNADRSRPENSLAQQKKRRIAAAPNVK